MGCKHRILSGDAMLILAYQYFEQYEPAVLCVGKIFSKQRLKSVKTMGCWILKLIDVTIQNTLK
jgi:geranylgeranyl diphosphate synthase type II